MNPQMRHDNIANRLVEVAGNVNDTITHCHVQAAVLVAERLPRVDEDNIGLAQLIQQTIHNSRACIPVLDRIDYRDDGVDGCRYGLRWGCDDISLDALFGAEPANMADVSCHGFGDNDAYWPSFLCGEFYEMNADIDFSETEDDMISSGDTKLRRDAKLANGNATPSAIIVYSISAQPEIIGVTVSRNVNCHRRIPIKVNE